MKINTKLFLLAGSLLLFACNSEPENLRAPEEKRTMPTIGATTSPNDLPAVAFTFLPEHDVKFIANGGTQLAIPANAFVDAKGNLITTEIELEVREGLNALAMVQGNLTTLSNGQLLESGGMIQVTASAEGNEVFLASSKSIIIDIPADSVKEGMSIFTGVADENGTLNWEAPIAIEETLDAALEEEAEKEERLTNVAIRCASYDKDERLFKSWEAGDRNPIPNYDELHEMVWGEDPWMIDQDTLIEFHGVWILLVKYETRDLNDGVMTFGEGAVNQFQEDQQTSYTFAMHNLGWANIDRLYNDPRTQEVELITRVKDQLDYDQIYVSMVFKNRNMYLPGYMKADSTFGFSHGDYEKQELPIGETSMVLVTCYQGDQRFFDYHKFTIHAQQDFELTPKPVTDAAYEQQLSELL